MPKPSKRSRPADEGLDPVSARPLPPALPPAELPQSDRDSLHDRIMQRTRDDAPAGTATTRAADMRWLAVGPGVEVKVLRSDPGRRDQTVLIRMQPGAVVVGHGHTQEEECWVLDGEIFIGEHRLGQGDMHVARRGAVHAPIHAPGGALLLIRSEMPPQGLRIA